MAATLRNTFQNLGELRERLVPYSPRFVALRLRTTEARLRDIESGREDATVWELDTLARLYGLDFDALADDPIVVGLGDSIATLPLQPEFRPLSDTTRERIVLAAAAARDVTELGALLDGTSDPRGALRQERAFIRPPRLGLEPHEAGRDAADQVRRKLGIRHDAPVTSVRDAVRSLFPSILVLQADLADPVLSGLTFCDASRGPTIILNARGKNENPCVRRFSLAHELAHLLLDWNQLEPLATITMMQDGVALEREQRANAFAASLLCPRAVVLRYAKGFEPFEAAAALVRDFGLHYKAACLQLDVVGKVKVPPGGTAPLDAASLDAWQDAERWPLHDAPALVDVPSERRSTVAELAARAYARDLISRDRFADLLAMPVSIDANRVLDYFSLDPPPRAADED